MDGMHFEVLKPPREEEDRSKTAEIISMLFAYELGGSNWRSQTKESVLRLVDQKSLELGISKGDSHYILLLKKLRPCKKVEDCLVAMTDFLLGKGL